MNWLWNSISDRLVLFTFLFVVAAISIFSPKMAVKILDDFSND